VVDLDTMKIVSTYQVGEDPDVLGFDAGLKRLYVSSESGTVNVFESLRRGLVLLGSFTMPHAHTFLGGPKDNLVYFPLENIDGHALLRIIKPTSAP
jgi:hypothetical protein